MWWLGGIWIGTLFGWLACSLIVRRSLELENHHLRLFVADLKRQIDHNELAVSRAYEIGKREGQQPSKSPKNYM